MGTIADLLGYSLSPEERAADIRADDDTQRESVSREPGGADVARQEIAMAIVLDECQLEPRDARAELLLRDDLDVDTLILYAIVTRIERELGIQLSDDSIAQWHTLGDLLEAVRIQS